MARPRLLLDRSQEVPPPAGYAVAVTEAEFIRGVVQETPLLVCGVALCRWAEEFCIGRDYGWEQVRPIAEWLRLHCPSLTDAQARDIQGLLAQREANAEDYRARAVLEALYREGPWSERPGREHAARWLLWLEESDPDAALTPLLAQIGHQWAQESPDGVAGLYGIQDRGAARESLAAWLGVTDGGPERAAWGDFPLAVPSRWRTQAQRLWAEESLSARPHLVERAQERRAPYDIRVEAAQMAAEYFRHHAKDLTPPVLASLEALLPEATAAQLRKLCPPSPPAPLPEGIGEVLGWFAAQYLPFRVWEQGHGDEAAHTAALDLVTQFEAWYLGFYPSALAGGTGSEHLSIQRSRRLQQSRADWVTLWVVFDGLTYLDGQALARMLAQESRLSLVSLTPVLSPLPTITQFCKRSVIEGLPSNAVGPAHTVPSWEGARELHRNQEAEALAALAGAALGDVFVWPLTQPDTAYHEKFDAPTIRRDVRSELEKWAARIRDGAGAVPAHLPLRVVFTTDHGRLLSVGARTVAVPAGMESHGRAAYGPSGQTFGETGTRRDEAAGLVFLDKDRFRLETDCAVALGSGVFQTNDGKTGQEWFPHGGLSPEEVLIPWGELRRDQAPPPLRASVSGQGRSGATHRALVGLENLGTVTVQAVAVVLTVGTEQRRLALDWVEVGPMSPVEVLVEVSRWPSKADAAGATATVEFVLPGGMGVTAQASVALDTQEMQSGRAASLEDLL